MNKRGSGLNFKFAFTLDFISSTVFYERKGDSGVTFVSCHATDYEYAYQDGFAASQYKRIRHLLEGGPSIPGIKKSRAETTKCIGDIPELIFSE